MNPDSQRIAIAEFCGYTHELWTNIGGGPCSAWFKPDKTFYNINPPDYLNDLNAMHEAEKLLREKGIISGYVHCIHKILNVNLWSHEDVICSSASQRAEAFLRTIEKWEL